MSPSQDGGDSERTQSTGFVVEISDEEWEALSEFLGPGSPVVGELDVEVEAGSSVVAHAGSPMREGSEGSVEVEEVGDGEDDGGTFKGKVEEGMADVGERGETAEKEEDSRWEPMEQDELIQSCGRNATPGLLPAPEVDIHTSLPHRTSGPHTLAELENAITKTHQLQHLFPNRPHYLPAPNIVHPPPHIHYDLQAAHSFHHATLIVLQDELRHNLELASAEQRGDSFADMSIARRDCFFDGSLARRTQAQRDLARLEAQKIRLLDRMVELDGMLDGDPRASNMSVLAERWGRECEVLHTQLKGAYPSPPSRRTVIRSFTSPYGITPVFHRVSNGANFDLTYPNTDVRGRNAGDRLRSLKEMLDIEKACFGEEYSMRCFHNGASTTFMRDIVCELRGKVSRELEELELERSVRRELDEMGERDVELCLAGRFW